MAAWMSTHESIDCGTITFQSQNPIAINLLLERISVDHTTDDQLRSLMEDRQLGNQSMSMYFPERGHLFPNLQQSSIVDIWPLIKFVTVLSPVRICPSLPYNIRLLDTIGTTDADTISNDTGMSDIINQMQPTLVWMALGGGFRTSGEKQDDFAQTLAWILNRFAPEQIRVIVTKSDRETDTNDTNNIVTDIFEQAFTSYYRSMIQTRPQLPAPVRVCPALHKIQIQPDQARNDSEREDNEIILMTCKIRKIQNSNIQVLGSASRTKCNRIEQCLRSGKRVFCPCPSTYNRFIRKSDAAE